MHLYDLKQNCLAMFKYTVLCDQVWENWPYQLKLNFCLYVKVTLMHYPKKQVLDHR